MISAFWLNNQSKSSLLALFPFFIHFFSKKMGIAVCEGEEKKMLGEGW